MRELDKTKSYYLGDLSIERFKYFYNEIKKQKCSRGIQDYDNLKKFTLDEKNSMVAWNHSEDMFWIYPLRQASLVNALDLFYTLENVQVDCRELSEEQIKDMFDIALVNGFEKREDSACYVDRQYVFFRQFRGSFGVLMELCSHHTITYDKFMELFGSKENNVIDNPQQGKKETTNKTKYELDFDFIEAMAKRIESETKYPPYNWQLPINTQDLADALFRHAIEVKKGNFDDDGELGHLMAIANNAMFLYYQKKNNELGE